MKIEEGKYYRTRGGEVVGPIKHKGFMFHDDQHPFFFLNWVYHPQGEYKDRFEPQYDLISEVYVSDTPPENAPETKTLRDEFAMAALMGLMAHPTIRFDSYKAMGKDIYNAADAMMEARKK